MPGRMRNIQLGSNGKGRATDIVYMSTQVINNVQKERDDISLCECQPLNVYGNGWHSPLDSFFLFSFFALFVSGGQKKKLATQTEPPTLLGVSPFFPSYDATTTTRRRRKRGKIYISFLNNFKLPQSLQLFVSLHLMGPNV